MENNINYSIVGIFVISLFAAIVLTIIWLSTGFSFEESKKYLVYMEESVSGLNVDSPVEYNGVVAGAVNEIEINKKNPKQVILSLDIKRKILITKGTRATLSTRGLTGLTFIALKDSGADFHPLKAKKGNPYPVIPSSPSIFMQLDTALSQLNKSFQTIAQGFQSLTNKDNQTAIHDILSNLKSVTQELAANHHEMHTIMLNTALASEQLAPLLHSSNSLLSNLQNQTLPGIYQIINNLNDMSRNLSSFSNELKQNPSVLIRGGSQQTLGPGETR